MRPGYRSCLCRVVSATGKGVAAQDTPQSFSDSPNNAVLNDCLYRVSRTGRIETTGRREQRRNKIFVAADQCNENTGREALFLFRCHDQDACEDTKLATVSVIRSGELREKSGRTVKTISVSGGYTPRFCRNDSLTIRLIRFLVTAPFTFLLMLMPMRL